MSLIWIFINILLNPNYIASNCLVCYYSNYNTISVICLMIQITHLLVGILNYKITSYFCDLHTTYQRKRKNNTGLHYYFFRWWYYVCERFCFYLFVAEMIFFVVNIVGLFAVNMQNSPKREQISGDICSFFRHIILYPVFMTLFEVCLSICEIICKKKKEK